MKYGYGRVSTHGQFKNGNSKEAQEEKLRAEGCDELYFDVYTGTKSDRPEFTKLLAKLQQGDTLVVTKLDRFARSTIEGIQTVKELFQRGVRVYILNMGLVEDTATGRLIFNVLCSFAEFERDLIVERTAEGKAIAKANNKDFREGRPNKFSKKHVENALQMLETHSYKEVEEKTGISKSTLIRAKKKKKATAE